MKLKKLLQVPSYKYSVRTILRWLWLAWRGNQMQAVLNATIGLLSVAVSLGQVSAVKHAIDVASHTISGNIYWAVAIMAVLILADFSLNIAGVWVRNLLGIRAQNRMQQRLLDRLLKAVWQGKERHHSADIINRLENDVNTVVNFLTETIPSTLSVVALFLGAFFYLFSMDKLLAIIIIAAFPIFMAFSKLYIGRMRHLTSEVRKSDSQVQSILQETIQHRMLIKTLEGVDMMVERLGDIQSALRAKVVKRTKFSVFSNIMINLGFAFGYLVAFLWAALRLHANTLSFGGMTAFLQLVNKIQSPARNLTKLVPAFVNVFTAAERLMELEENPLEEQGKPIYLDTPCGIRIDNIDFHYIDDDTDVIQQLSFDFKPGSSTAILGETGSGKTTLIKLILALLQPQNGSIEIYNKTTHQRLSPLHRCNIVYVPQGNTLMSGSIRENLYLGKLNATDEEMWEVLHKSCADFVEDLPLKLDTLCSEQGGGLSEGQAQRIAIARSLLRSGSIMIFDEATSALDPATERQLLHNILADQQKTVLFITHRSAVIDYCDQTLTIQRR